MASPTNPTEPAESRRKFLRRAFLGCAGCGLGTLGYAHFIEPHWLTVERRSMPIANLPDALIGKRLVQISDIHVGENLDHQYIVRAISSIWSLKPDLIVITGDLMTCRTDEQVDRTVDVMNQLPAAPFGHFAVLGNHDYGVGWRRNAVAEKLVLGLENHNIRVLRNEIAEIEGMQLIGVDDLWSGRCQPRVALEHLQTDMPAIALCHNPDGADLPGWDRFRGWILAGHTHGGQCKPPWLDPPILPVRNKRYAAGEVQLSGGRRMYINRGLGYVRRVRFNCPPEITVFKLQREMPAQRT